MADKSVNGLTNTFSNMFRKNGIAGQEMLSQDEAEPKLDGFVHDTDTNRGQSDSVASNDSGIGDCEVDIDPETGLELISLDEVSYHCTMEDGWMVIYDKVYEVTEYLMKHPGGEDVMMEYLGYDATMAFRGVGHSQVALAILQRYLVGILPRTERLGYYSDMLIC